MFLLFSFSLIKHLLHDLHVYLFLVLFHLFLVNFYAFRKLKDSGESCMGVRNVQNDAKRSSAEKLTCTAVRLASSIFASIRSHGRAPC